MSDSTTSTGEPSTPAEAEAPSESQANPITPELAQQYIGARRKLQTRPERELKIEANIQSQTRRCPPSGDDAAVDQFEAQQEQEQRSERTRKLWSAAQVPLRHARLAELGGPPAWFGAHNNVLKHLGRGLLCALIGPRGTGKTQLAVEAIRWMTQSLVRSARYAKAFDIFLDIRATYAPQSERSERDVVRAYREPALLVLDEIHVRGEKPWEDVVLTNIIDKRYDAELDTIIISNQTRDEVKASLGPSICDRLRECGGIIECEWQSFRRAASA